MKKFIWFICFVISILSISHTASGSEYYVSPTGNDNNPGSKTAPWISFHKAAKTAKPGDTVFFRGGVYPLNVSIFLGGLAGTAQSPICYFNYPGEVPIFDARGGLVDDSGIQIYNSSYIHIRGITVRNIRQTTQSTNATGIFCYNSNNIIIENCVSHDIGARAYYCQSSDEVRFINCDAYNVNDSLSADPGQHGDGWLVWDNHTSNYPQDTTKKIYFYGCRAWNCSDDGWDAETEGLIVLDNCWSFRNTRNGFKLGLAKVTSENVGKRISNCVAVFNGTGFTTNDNDCAAKLMYIFNNTAYKNNHGFLIYNTIESSTRELRRIYKNNLAYDNISSNSTAYGGSYYSHDHNSWDISGLSLSARDFLSLDSTGLTARRQINGSLPDNNCYKYFLRLASGSNAIDAGTDVGLKYYGIHPDLGAFEYSESTSNSISIVNINVTGAGGSTKITTKNGTLQLTAAILPVDATNKTVIWSILTGSEYASINSSGLLTALKNGTVIVKAAANDGSGVFGTLTVTISNQNSPPNVLVNYKPSVYSGFVEEISAAGSYDVNKDNLAFTWITPKNISVSGKSGPTIKFLSPIVNSTQKVEFTLLVSDGSSTQSKVIPIEILPYNTNLDVAEILNIEASDFQDPYLPYNVIDGNIGTMWAAYGYDQWLIAKLKDPFSVQHIKLAFQTDRSRESFFDILGSKDSIIWEPILTKMASCNFSSDLQVFEFPKAKSSQEFNYIKIIGKGNSADEWNYISELKIYGVKHNDQKNYKNRDVKIFPNPAKEFLTVRIDEPTLYSDFIQLLDLSGRIVLRSEIDPETREFTIPLNLKKGVYIIQLILGNITLFSQQLVING